MVVLGSKIVPNKAKCWMQLFLRSTFCNFWTQLRWDFFSWKTFIWVSTQRGLINFWHSCFHAKNFCALQGHYVQTSVRSMLPMSSLSWFKVALCLDYCAFKVTNNQTIVRSKLPMSRLSCVHSCLQTAKFRTHQTPLCVHLGLDISTFVLWPQACFSKLLL